MIHLNLGRRNASFYRSHQKYRMFTWNR